MTKRIAFYDTECYPNFWLLKFSIRPGVVVSYSLREGERLTMAQRREIVGIFTDCQTVSFNGNGYDVPMITGALSGMAPAELKALNDNIIVDRIKPWELGLPEWKPADHIDVMEVAPGAGSQKQYAGRIHCKTMRDLPYDPAVVLTDAQIADVDAYCGNDLDVLEALFVALRPQLKQRERLSARYGMDLMSKSDAQIAEAVLRKRCEAATGRRIFKQEVDWDLSFQYRPPEFVAFHYPHLQRMLDLVRRATFRLGASGAVEMPPELADLEIIVNQTSYKLGIGGIHSQEKRIAHRSDADYVLLDNDVASYYPSLILNSGEVPPALGHVFREEYAAIRDERLAAKELQARLKAAGQDYDDAQTDNEGGKIQINGTFGKTGSPYSVLFAPNMLIQTTLTGQLSLLMLIEWHECYGIPVVSANTDGMVIKCPRHLVPTSRALIEEWQRRTGLMMETVEYSAIYSRDVNNYIAIKADGSVKRKGEYSRAGLIEKKNPDVEICADAVADYLAKGVPIDLTIAMCRDIRKFVTVQRVSGGGVKLHGEVPRKGALVRDMVPTLTAHGWFKDGRFWRRNGERLSAGDAYAACFGEPTREYLGKVVRWYYGTRSPGPIVYATNGNTVGMSYGAAPCMTLPDEFPDDVDYQWYIDKARHMLSDMGA